MAIVIKPKNIFDKSVSRDNHNYIRTVGYPEKEKSTRVHNIYESEYNIWSYDETNKQYIFNKDIENEFEIVKISGLTQQDFDLVFAYKYLDAELPPALDYSSFLSYMSDKSNRQVPQKSAIDIWNCSVSSQVADIYVGEGRQLQDTSETTFIPEKNIIYANSTDIVNMSDFLMTKTYISNCGVGNPSLFSIIVLMDLSTSGNLKYILVLSAANIYPRRYQVVGYGETEYEDDVDLALVREVRTQLRIGLNVPTVTTKTIQQNFDFQIADNELFLNGDLGKQYKDISSSPVFVLSYKPYYGAGSINSVSVDGYTTPDWSYNPVSNKISITQIGEEYEVVYDYAPPVRNSYETLKAMIISNYQNGKVTMDLECSIDDYYDEEGNKVISKRGIDGLPMTFTNNDIVRPKRVKMVRKSDGSMEQEQCDLVEGKIFRVVGVRIKYDGKIMQELTLQEEKS